MGNGSSQSMVLGAPRHSDSHPLRYPVGYSGIPKYAHPHNRVLPKPVDGQTRLRSTDNGNILQAAGTIRGLKRGEFDPEETRKRSGEKENAFHHRQHINLRNHRLFHSDPNIARRPSHHGASSPQECCGGGNRRNSNGGVATRTSKLKYKKKTPAPQPPPSGSSLPRQLGKRSNHQDEMSRMGCKCVSKTRAPQPPPSVVVHPPPPPPPLPDAVTTRTSSRASPQQSITRAVETRTSYEKNVHPLEKWRNCRSSGDIRIDEEDETPGSRTTVFDSRTLQDTSSHPRLPSHLPQRPDPFQKEIQAVTQKIAQNRHEPLKPPSDPPKFYFADVDVFKNLPPAQMSGQDTLAGSKSTIGVLKSEGSRHQERTAVDEVVPSLQRFSPNRRRVRSPNGRSSPHSKANQEWDHLSKNLIKKPERDIDVRLRPVLPRKQPEVPNFSPSEAWQALGSDGFGSSNQSTSDDGPELFRPYKKNGALPRHDKPQRLVTDSRKDVFQHRIDTHWTPRQDLLDDSDVSSEDSEDAVVPRMCPDLEISTRFSLPTVMFSNMRPIGTDFTKSNAAQPTYLNGSAKAKQSKKKMVKSSIEPTYENNSAPNFRRFLSKRNKFQSEEDLAVSDSNWTFGQYGLQKRGKQYSSELILTDKKKHELDENFSDFLGDILVSKANHMRNQMKSSDSGNSNFSFYSTEGVMFLPEKEAISKEECSPPTKGRVYNMRRRFDPNIEQPQQRPNYIKGSRKNISTSDLDLGRKRDLELAKMLEDEVRKRRNKEKISIRQQLQRMNKLQVDDEVDDFDDEAYFTEPKSRESPFYAAHNGVESGFGIKPSHFRQEPSKTAVESARLSHWQSSPAIMEDSPMNKGTRPTTKGRISASSVMSSPSPDTWLRTNSAVDTWLQGHGRSSGVLVVSKGQPDHANDGDVSSSPTPAPPKKKERRKTNIYKQLMDIVRKEEKHLKNAQRNGGQATSRDSSYSQRESSTCSDASSTTSYSCSDSSTSKKRNGVQSASKEFHVYQHGGLQSSGYSSKQSSSNNNVPSSDRVFYDPYIPGSKEFHIKGRQSSTQKAVPVNKEFQSKNHSSTFQMAFAQPYSASKSYRPVPFDVAASGPYRMPGLQEEGHTIQTGVS